MKEYWFPWIPGKYKSDTMHLSPLEDGVYRRLIDHYMETKSPLPHSEVALARIAGLPQAEFRQMSGTILAFFRKLEDGLLHSKTCDKILLDQSERSDKHREKSSAGGKAKAEKYNNINEISATGKPQAMPKRATRQDKTRQDKKDIINSIKPEDVSNDVWLDWIIHRKAKKAPITKTVIADFRKQAEIANVTLEEAIGKSISRGWQGFEADWLTKENKNGKELTGHAALAELGKAARRVAATEHAEGYPVSRTGLLAYDD